MNVKQKFFALSGVAGLIMAVVSVVGYFTASDAVKSTTEKEIVAAITAASNEAEGWLLQKAQYGEATARMLSAFPAQDNAIVRRKEMTATYKGDKDIIDITHATDSGYCVSYAEGDITKDADWTKREWFVDAKKAGKLIFTDPYIDSTTKKLCITAAIPYTRQGAAIKTEMEEINGAVKTVSDGMQNIVQAMDTIDEVSRTTSEETQTISAAAEEQSASSQEIASASHSLADLATELQSATGQFRI